MKFTHALLALLLVGWSTLATHASPMLATNNPLYLPLVTANKLNQLAYTQSGGVGLQSSNLYVVNVDGTGETRLSDTYATQPTWSPDGTRLTFVCADTQAISLETPRGLCTIRADGTEETKLRFSPVLTTTTDPAWSPDGTQIVFSASSSYYDAYHLYSLTLADGRLRQLTDGPIDDRFPAWSPDGTQIAFSSYWHGYSQISVMRADGTNRQPITDGSSFANQPSWSPDGTRLAWQRNNNSTTAIMVMRVDGTSQQPLLEIPLTRGMQVSYPVWSRDGREIAYMMNGVSSARSVEIYRMNQDGTGSRRVVAGVCPAWRPYPSN